MAIGNAFTVTFPFFNQFQAVNTCKMNANNADNQLSTWFWMCWYNEHLQ